MKGNDFGRVLDCDDVDPPELALLKLDIDVPELGIVPSELGLELPETLTDFRNLAPPDFRADLNEFRANPEFDAVLPEFRTNTPELAATLPELGTDACLVSEVDLGGGGK
jgi:hypothetical protein